MECRYSERIRGEMKQLEEWKICRKVKEEEREASSGISVIKKWKKDLKTNVRTKQWINKAKFVILFCVIFPMAMWVLMLLHIFILLTPHNLHKKVVEYATKHHHHVHCGTYDNCPYPLQSLEIVRKCVCLSRQAEHVQKVICIMP